MSGVVRRALRSPAILIGGTLAGATLVATLVSLVWTPWPATAIDIAAKLQGPSAAHLLGTDPFGRDVLSMLMVGARTSVVVALVAVALGAGVGVPLGLAAAAIGGLIDDLISRLADFVFAFPVLLSAVMVTAVLGPGAVNAIIAIGLFNIPVFARVARAGALAIRQRDFIAAARLAGKGEAAIAYQHILPNIAALLVVQVTIQFALAILAEASLSYLGLGVQPPAPSWGKMLNDAQTYMFLQPWLAVFPGLAIALTVLGINLLGDGLSDLLDPQLRRAV